MRSLLDLFLAHCLDLETLRELRRMVDHEAEWANAHRLFDRIRGKTLAAERAGDQAAACQYCFEEVCAKSLYNLTDCDNPFDEDAPYWIIPNALSAAKAINLPETSVTKIAVA